jgi:NAD(P)-dependent dehydrogenase (short-subunit alcohol dehydrogenase family)
MELAGKVAVVTGGAGGIGRATAKLLAANGAAVVVADLKDDMGRETVDQITHAGGTATYRHVDLTVEPDVEALMAHAVEAFGRLDIAVNNAGITGAYGPVARLSLADWRRVMAVNLDAVFLCIRAEVPRLLDSGGGAIVNTASAAGLMGFAQLPAYVAAKHAVIGLTKSVALEHARHGIRVNAVCPGSVRTPMLEAFAGSAEAVESMGSVSPIGRVAAPEEIAEAIVWLCSARASYVTGVAVPIDGGALAT